MAERKYCEIILFHGGSNFAVSVEKTNNELTTPTNNDVLNTSFNIVYEVKNIQPSNNLSKLRVVFLIAPIYTMDKKIDLSLREIEPSNCKNAFLQRDFMPRYSVYYKISCIECPLYCL